MGHLFINRKTSLFFVILVCIITYSGNIQNYPGTNIRGQILYFNQYNGIYYPLSNATVDLYYNPSPNVYKFVAETIANVKGFYFFYRVNPPGNYFIQVNKAKNYQVSIGKIDYYNYYNLYQFWNIPVLYY